MCAGSLLVPARAGSLLVHRQLAPCARPGAGSLLVRRPAQSLLARGPAPSRSLHAGRLAARLLVRGPGPGGSLLVRGPPGSLLVRVPARSLCAGRLAPCARAGSLLRLVRGQPQAGSLLSVTVRAGPGAGSLLVRGPPGLLLVISASSVPVRRLRLPSQWPGPRRASECKT